MAMTSNLQQIARETEIAVDEIAKYCKADLKQPFDRETVEQLLRGVMGRSGLPNKLAEALAVLVCNYELGQKQAVRDFAAALTQRLEKVTPPSQRAGMREMLKSVDDELKSLLKEPSLDKS